MVRCPFTDSVNVVIMCVNVKVLTRLKKVECVL